MRYDDRLGTVLRLPITGRNLARVQLTQLLDLLGAAPSAARSDLLDAGYLRLNALCQEFPPHEIAAMLGQPDLRLRSPRLVASLCHAAPPVAMAALHAAQLDEASWLDLIPALPPACWSLLWHRQDLAPAPRALLARLGAAAMALPTGTHDTPERGAPVAPVAGEASLQTLPLATEALAKAEPEPSASAKPLPARSKPPAKTPAMAPTKANDTDSQSPAAPPEGPVTAQATANAPLPPLAPMPVWQHQADDGIGAIVRRIEAFRHAREAAQREAANAPLSQDAPRLPLGEDAAAPAPMAFDFETDCDGCIIRADAGVAQMVVGLDLADLAVDEPAAQWRSHTEMEPGWPEAGAIAERLRHQQPIRATATHLAGAPAIAGAWQLDATPHFDMLGGRFVGYLGRFRRLDVAQAAIVPALADTQATTAQPSDSHADRLRQSLHELRTPVNAIQGFAEIIQQQLFGPTPHEYRALAAVIAADAARMLAGFEELERLARIDTGAMELASGTSDLAECVRTALVQLAPHATAHDITLKLDDMDQPLPLALATIETERLCWRVMATLVSAARAGEAVTLRLADDAGFACLTISLPKVLAKLCDDEAGYHALFHASVRPTGDSAGAVGAEAGDPDTAADAVGPSAGMFGTGFALRLARAEARAAGGNLTVENTDLCLRLPGLTQTHTGHSVESGGKSS